MKKMILTLLLLTSSITANAAYIPLSNTFYLTAPDTPASFIALYCEENLRVIEGSTEKMYKQLDCLGTPHNVLVSSPTITDLAAITIGSDMLTLLQAPNVAAVKTAMTLSTVATTGDYNDLSNKPSIGSRTFNYPSRALNSCFQISSTKDAMFHYKVDVASGTLLAGTATGTVTATSYTNSGCTTGAQTISEGVASQGAALGILSVSQIASVGIDGTLPSGKWIKITTAQTAGTPTFSIRATQSEILL